MKKSLVVTLALVFVLGIAGTAFANPYSDVPAGHWAYKAVVDLQKAGVMEGANGKFMGNQTLTRYEIAAITARAMAKADKADAATKATIDKLAVEFSKELNDLGVRVAKLEKNNQNLKFTGQLRQRFEYVKDAADETTVKTRVRLFMNGNLDDNWKFVGRLANESTWGKTNKKLVSGADTISQNSFNEITIDQAYVTGKIGEIGVAAGRQANALGQLSIADSSTNWDGLKLSYTLGDVSLMAGNLRKAGFTGSTGDGTDSHTSFTVGNVAWKASQDLTVTGSYMKDSLDSAYDTTAYGFAYTGIENFKLTAEAGKNDIADADAYMVYLKYKGANNQKVDSWGMWVGYRNAEKGFDPKTYTTFEYADAGIGAYDDVKGYEVGFDWAPFKNAVLEVKMTDLDKKSVNDSYEKQYIAQMIYAF